MNKDACFIRAIVVLLVVLMAAPYGAFAQNTGTSRTFRQEELDQMLAPIALYPDSLLAQMLVAATYPVQVTEADRWVRQNPDLKGDALNSALDRTDWDLSVKALVPFPQVLSMMDDKLSWTENLGEAFLAQQADVMDTVQKLRARAQAQGNLKSTREQTVLVKGDSIEIEPANPEVVYVPYYDPAVIYGSWWYPAYPPYAWYPYFPAGPIITYGLFGFAAGIAVASAWNWGWGHWDWGRRDININVSRNVNINRHDIGRIRTSSWSHEVSQRRLSSSRNFGMRDAGRPGAGTRSSAASVEKGLHQHQGTVRSNQAGVGSAHGQANRNATLGRPNGNLAHGGGTIHRNANITHGGAAMTHGNFVSHGGGIARSGGNHGVASFSRGGGHGGASFAHGGGGGGGRHGCGSRHC
jgi:hypothetical protein